MAIYHIKKPDEQIINSIEPPQEYWQVQEPQHARDLDFEEIAEINAKYENVNEPHEETHEQEAERISWWKVLFSVALVVIITVWLFSTSFNTNIDYGIRSDSGNLAREYPELAELRNAVVNIEGVGSAATGFNIDASGLIVTNHHVVEDEKAVSITFPNRFLSFVARNWVIHDSVDLAVIDIDGTDLPYLELGTTMPQIGDTVYFIGNPLGNNWALGEGTVNNLLDYAGTTLIIIDGGIRSGSSGSPLFNKDLEVIGVIFASFEDVEDSGLAIPISYLTTILEEIYEQ